MVVDIVCDEAGSCKLDVEFGKMTDSPRDLIPLSNSKSSHTTLSRKTSPKKKIKGSGGVKRLSNKTTPRPRGRPKKAPKLGKRPQKKQVNKPKRRGRPPLKK